MSFIMCNRNEILVSEILNKNSNAFILLYFIAMRAWRGPGRSPRDCDMGEALIGDYSKMGMTQQNYRTAKKHLEKMGFITTRSTTKGTIAKLMNTELFDPNFDFSNDQINGQLTSKQRTANGQATTNNNCKNSNNWNKRERAHSQNENECNESIPDQTEVIDHGNGGAAIPEWYCKHYHEQKEIKLSWLNGHGKLINWRREIVAWFNKDGKPLRENEHAKSNRGGGRKTNANTGTSNEGIGHLYSNAGKAKT
jgi:hypothetical protein